MNSDPNVTAMRTTLDDRQLARLQKMARGFSLNLFLGLFAIALSFIENSPAWTCYVLLTGWIGVVMGLTGGPGYADHLLKRGRGRHELSSGTVIVLSLITFWIPTLAAAVYGLALSGGLRESIQPQSRLDDVGIKLIIQSFAMFYLSAGTTWAIVAAEAKKTQRAVES